MLYAEMFAYSMAAAQLGLKHSLLKGLMTGCMVGWPQVKVELLEQAVKIIEDANGDLMGAATCFPPSISPPPLLHYCQFYPSILGGGFAKRAVPHDILGCEKVPGGKHGTPKRAGNAGGNKEARDKFWNTLAHCAATRGIYHARDVRCAQRDKHPVSLDI